MAEVINFNEYKEKKDLENNIERGYLNFLDHIQNYLPAPKNSMELIKTLYFAMRFVDGTLNCFVTLASLGLLKDEDISYLKENFINWAQDHIDTASEL